MEQRLEDIYESLRLVGCEISVSYNQRNKRIELSVNGMRIGISKTKDCPGPFSEGPKLSAPVLKGPTIDQAFADIVGLMTRHAINDEAFLYQDPVSTPHVPSIAVNIKTGRIRRLVEARRG
jgi:hypothetical protein